MSESAGIDLAPLLAPISADTPAGTDPREDVTAQSAYYRLRDARSEAREIERSAESATAETPVPQQWRVVRELAAETLRTRAKDLEIAAWLTEALVREVGIAGLTAGSTVIAGLVEAFWDAGLFPTPDEDGIATLVAPVAGLNGLSGDGTLAQSLRKQVMFLRPDGTPLTFWEFAQAERVEAIGDAARKKQMLAAGTPAFADVARDAKAAGSGHFAALRDELENCLSAWAHMGAVLDGRAGSDSPPTGRVRELLAGFLSAAQQFTSARIATAEAPPADDPAAASVTKAAETGATSAPRAAAPAASREDMLAELARIADYFRKSEPQSPLSLTLDDAIRRARLSWTELLEEVVTSEDTRNSMLSTLGIRPPKTE